MREICTSSLTRGRDIARKHGMQSLGTYRETQKHALLKPTLTAVPSLYPQTVLFALAEASAVAEVNLAMARHLVQEWC